MKEPIPFESRKKRYGVLIQKIGRIVREGRANAANAINEILLHTYWEVGKNIIKYEQEGKEKAEYGSSLLERLSADLKQQYGRGFSRRNVFDMRRFYLNNKIWQTLSAKLSWSHHIELLSLEDNKERMFYEKQCEKESWSVRELKRQISSLLFQRVELSENKQKKMLSKKTRGKEHAEDLIKDPYVLEFLDIPEGYGYTEKELERRIIHKLQMFLLELGKGFTFVARQKRMTIGNKHFHVDLVFYHKNLRSFVLIDLKIGKADYKDVGQMNMYLNYFKKEENKLGDKEPIGIILSARKDQIEMEYALGGLSNKVFVSKYKLYLPKKEEIEEKVRKLL